MIEMQGVYAGYALSACHGSLHDCSLRVEHGEIMALIGPNGAGKTTAIRVIIGALQPMQGRVYINDIDVTDVSPYKRKVGYVPQTLGLLQHRSVEGNLLFPLEVARVPKQRHERLAVIEPILAFAGLTELRHCLPKQLSGGQRQRVAIARVLTQGVDVCVFDEPLASVDVITRRRMRDQLADLLRRAQKTTIFVTHDPVEASIIADRVAVIDNGRIVQVGTFEELQNNPASELVAELTTFDMLVRKSTTST